FPLLFRVAMDILPMQASSVFCERAFSSSKETITAHCSKLSPIMLEMLQVLKYIFRNEDLDFTSGWRAATEDEL
ncbi:hypothetical protein JAAARDRAFT_96584, partial [Jaapia argillacea MUCL 33604]